MMPRPHFLHKLYRVVNYTIPYSYKASFSTSAISNKIHAKWNAPTNIKIQNRINTLKFKGKYKTFRRSEFLDWNYDSELYAFGKRLNETFDDQLLREALRDHSYVFKQENLPHNSADEKYEPLKSNKELAVAGRAIVENFSKKFLRAIWPMLPEEGIEILVHHLCSTPILAEVGSGIGLKDLIFCEEYPPSNETYSTALLAIISVLNQSSGEDRCNLFIRDFIITQLISKDLWDIWQIEHPFELLTDLLLQSDLEAPEPRVIGELGKNTIEAVYNIGIYSNKEFIGSGFGETHQIGLNIASLNTLGRLFGRSLGSDPIPLDEDPCNIELKSTPNLYLKAWRIPKAHIS